LQRFQIPTLRVLRERKKIGRREVRGFLRRRKETTWEIELPQAKALLKVCQERFREKEKEKVFS